MKQKFRTTGGESGDSPRNTMSVALADKRLINSRGGRRARNRNYSRRVALLSMENGTFVLQMNLKKILDALRDSLKNCSVERTNIVVQHTRGTQDEVLDVARSLYTPIMTYVKSGGFVRRKTKRWLVTFYDKIWLNFETFFHRCTEINQTQGIKALMSWVKDYTSWSMLKAAGTVVDLDKKPDRIFSGRLERFVRKHVVRASPTSRELLRSLHFGKNVWPSLRDEDLQAKMDAHKIIIARPISAVPDIIAAEIRGNSIDVFKGGSDKSVPLVKFVPTGRSCIQESLRRGGTMSLTKQFQRDLILEGIVGRMVGLSVALATWREEEWQYCIDKSYEAFLNGTATDIKIIAVDKPGSARILSLGCGYTNNALMPLQGWMIQMWQRAFQSTMWDEDLTERLQEMADANPELPYFFASDYTNATNLLNRVCSYEALEGVKGNPLSDIARWSFGAGVAEFPDGEKVVHQEAQMMGHTLSFPLLCVINRAILSCALKHWQKYTAQDGEIFMPSDIGPEMKSRRPNIYRTMLRKRRQAARIFRRALINGDDILFKADLLLVKLFTGFAHDTGFKIEATKQFLSRNFATINSQDFHIFPSGKVRRLRYLNQRVLYGSKDRESMANPLSVTRDLNRMLLPMKWGRGAFSIALDRFQVRDPGQWHGFFPNWYLPTHLGGYGLDPAFAKNGDEIKFTRPQRLVAAHFVNDPSNCLFVSTNKLTAPVARLSKFLLQKCEITFPKTAVVDSETVDDDGSFFFGLFDSVAEEEEAVVIEKNDPWEGRLCLLNRLNSSMEPPDEGFNPRNIKRIRHLVPIRSENIRKYLNTTLTYSEPLPCPPQSNLRPVVVRTIDDLSDCYGCSAGSKNVIDQTYSPFLEWPELHDISSWGL